MKITYISSETFPSHNADSLQVMKMCEAMMEEGHEIRLIAPRTPEDSSSADSDYLRLYGVRRAVRPEFRPYRHSVYGIALYGIMGRICSRGRVAYTRRVAYAAVCALTGVPTVLEIHWVPERGTVVDKLLRIMLRLDARNLHLVTITEAIRDELVARYSFASQENMIVAPDGVDLARFDSVPNQNEARHILNLPKDARVAGYVGSLAKDKGADTIAQLAARMPEIHFVIVGDRGGDLNELRQIVAASGNDNLTTPGNIGNSEVPVWLSACDILLLPNKLVPGYHNIHGLWTSPLKMFEYMAAEKPIIASDLPVLREVLDEDIATLVPPDDIDSWAAAIAELANSPERATSLAAAARRRVEAKYTWRARVRRCLDGLETI